MICSFWKSVCGSSFSSFWFRLRLARIKIVFRWLGNPFIFWDRTFSLLCTHHIFMTSNCCFLRYHIVLHKRKINHNCNPWHPTLRTGFHGFDIYKYPLEFHLKEEYFWSNLVENRQAAYFFILLLCFFENCISFTQLVSLCSLFLPNSSHTTISSLSPGMV